MDPTTHIQPLPLWVLLSCVAVVVGVITLIYTQGNWRVAMLLVGFIFLIIFLLHGFDTWKEYLNSHFIGVYDETENYIIEAGPGAIILLKSWPLWILPVLLIVAIAVLVDRIIIKTQAAVKTVIVEDNRLQPVQDINQQLESGILKQKLKETEEKLATTIATAESQIDKNLELEIKLSQLEDQKDKFLLAAEEKYALLNAELIEKSKQNESLILLTLEQSEEILRLKKQQGQTS